MREFGKKKLGLCFNVKFPVKKNKGLKLLLSMGCICSKGTKEENSLKDSKKSSKRLAASLEKEETEVDVDNGGNDATTRLISSENADKSTGTTPVAWEEGDTNIPMGFEKSVVAQMPAKIVTETKQDAVQPQMCRVLSARNGVDGAQVVAGWPTWLTAVAGEAIKGWIPRRAESFEKLDKVKLGDL